MLTTADVCNLGSINLGRVDDLKEFTQIVELATKFLICGTLKAKLPYEAVYKTREKNRRLGLGLMGMHEWLIKKGSKYEVTDELHKWLAVYQASATTLAVRWLIVFQLAVLWLIGLSPPPDQLAYWLVPVLALSLYLQWRISAGI